MLDPAAEQHSLRAEQVAQTRAALVAAGYRLFGENGFRATSVEDLASANGTFLNGSRVAKRVPLKPGDAIRLGGTEFVFAEE